MDTAPQSQQHKGGWQGPLWITTRADEAAYFVEVANCDGAAKTLDSLSPGNFLDSTAQRLFEASNYLHSRKERITPETLSAQCARRADESERQSDADEWHTAARIALCELATVPSGPNTPGERAERLARKIKEQAPATAILPVFGFPVTDTGNAERFAAQHGQSVRFCHPWGIWLVFDGKRWAEDESGGVERLAKDTARSIYAEVARETEDGRRVELKRHASKTESRKARADFLQLARSENGIAVLPCELDAAPHLLNLENGTLDLQAVVFREHRRADLLTRLCPVAFDANAVCPTWRAALEQWLPNVATRDFVQDAAGASLSGLAFDEFWMFLYGDGANGKSTFTRVLEWLFGDYGHKAQAETFMDAGRDRDRGKPAPELLSMRGKRLVTVQETAKRHRLNEALIKDFTGRDSITARGIREKAETTFAPQFTLWMFGNHKPIVNDTSAGTWRRIRLIPFDQTIPENKRDPQLAEKLRAELPGILNWALDGLRRVHERGLVVPDAVKLATAQYREESDRFAEFLAEKCIVGKRHFASSKDLWAVWCDWCRETGEKEGTRRSLGKDLSDRQFCKKMKSQAGKDVRGWEGIGILASASDTYVSEMSANSDT